MGWLKSNLIIWTGLDCLKSVYNCLSMGHFVKCENIHIFYKNLVSSVLGRLYYMIRSLHLLLCLCETHVPEHFAMFALL